MLTAKEMGLMLVRVAYLVLWFEVRARRKVTAASSPVSNHRDIIAKACEEAHVRPASRLLLFRELRVPPQDRKRQIRLAADRRRTAQRNKLTHDDVI